jgi:hypothetical protein
MHDVSNPHPLEHLAQLLADFGEYPDEVEPVPACITGVAFFPGGAGLWGAQLGRRLPPMPQGKVMVLGHNFDSVKSYEVSRKRGYGDINGATWGTLRKLLPQWGIPLEDCFFTNVYMGLKADTDTPTGAFPGAKSHSFTYRCHAFLLRQIQTQQPRFILALGKEVPPVLAPLSPQLTATWSGARNLQELDARDVSLIRDAQFPGVDHLVTVAVLTHPAMRHLNIDRRSYNGQKGDAAEIALVHDGLAACGLVS